MLHAMMGTAAVMMMVSLCVCDGHLVCDQLTVQLLEQYIDLCVPAVLLMRVGMNLTNRRKY